MAFDPITAVSDLINKGLDKFVRDKVDEGTLLSIKNDMEKHILSEARQADSAFRQFVVQYEGEAKDYKDVPLVGPLLLVLRGAIRPLFTLAVAYWDWLWFTDVTASWPDSKAQLLASVNMIVLIFWFGERAVTNSGIVDKLMQAFIGRK